MARRPSPKQAHGHDAIARVLGGEILSGARKPGSRMPGVDEMFSLFGVSRVVVREVTKTLAAKGLVTAKTKVGTLVLAPSHWNWLDPDVLAWRAGVGLDVAFLNRIGEVRLAVEPLSAALAAHNAGRADRQRIKTALRQMHAAGGDHRKFADADLAFHVAIGEASGNPFFRSFTAVIRTALSGILAMTSIGVIADEKTHARSTARHEKVWDAIRAGDEDAARKAMVRVIEEGLKHSGAKRRAR